MEHIDVDTGAVPSPMTDEQRILAEAIAESAVIEALALVRGAGRLPVTCGMVARTLRVCAGDTQFQELCDIFAVRCPGGHTQLVDCDAVMGLCVYAALELTDEICCCEHVQDIAIHDVIGRGRA